MLPDLHPDLQALAPLLGTWQGRGSGTYPTIEPFDYLEEVAFSHVGKPFLVYGQKTKSAADGKPLHAETGYLRVPQPGHVELVLAHPWADASESTATNCLIRCRWVRSDNRCNTTSARYCTGKAERRLKVRRR